MTGRPRGPRPGEPLDDAAIEQLVREAAEGWTMPPVRLDAPSWRDRVRSPRARGLDAARGWLARVGSAATGAIALTLVGALAAVLITRDPTAPGGSAEPTPPGSPAPSGAPATPLPQLFRDGELPSPSRVLVQTERGDFAIVDLATGESGGNLTGAAFGSSIQTRSDGSFLCLCVKVSGNVNGRPTDAEVTIDRFDRSGDLTSSEHVATLSGQPDPRDGPIPERPPHLAFATAFSEGAHFGFVGWSERAGLSWRSGIIVVDLTEDREVGRVNFPDASAGEGEVRRVVLAPQVVGVAGGSAYTISRETYQWSPPASQGESFLQSNEVYRAELDAGSFANLAPVDASRCGERVLRTGALPDGAGWWLACQSFVTGDIVVRRFDPGGAVLGDVTVPAGLGVDGDVTAVSPDARVLFVWNAVSATLTRVDLASGDVAEGRAAAAASAPGPLAEIGAWLAPPAAAKTFLDAGIIVSPDGARVYAAGVDPGADVSESGGSSGIFVFDSASLQLLDRWAPTADVVSLAVSVDGRSVYAAGLPGVDAGGEIRPGQQASVTVFAAADGAIQLIAGELGHDLITFVAPTLD